MSITLQGRLRAASPYDRPDRLRALLDEAAAALDAEMAANDTAETSLRSALAYGRAAAHVAATVSHEVKALTAALASVSGFRRHGTDEAHSSPGAILDAAPYGEVVAIDRIVVAETRYHWRLPPADDVTGDEFHDAEFPGLADALAGLRAEQVRRAGLVAQPSGD